MSLPAVNFPSKKKYSSPYSNKIIPEFIHEPIIIPKPIISEDVYWRDYYEHHDIAYEWNNGYLEVKPMSDHVTCLIYNWFMKLLLLFLDTRPIATYNNLDMGFTLALGNNRSAVRKPDLGVVLNDNHVPLLDSDRSYHGIFDLCVEALSDSDKQQKERDTITKKAEYAATGVKEYFILHDSEEQAFYRLNAQGVYVPICPREDDVITSEVLPGFQFRIADLSARPSPEAMLEDPIYQGFIFPGWQLALQRAEKAEQRAEEAEQRVTIEAALRLEAEQRAKIEATLRLEAEQRTHIAQAEIVRLKVLLEAHIGF